MRRPSVTARSRRPPHRTTGGTGTRRTWTLARAGALRTRPPTPPGATWRTSSTSLPPPIDAQQWSLHSRPRALARGLGTLHSTAVRPPRTDVPPASAQRRLRVVVDAGHGELAALAADVDGDAGLGRQVLRPQATTLYSSAQACKARAARRCRGGCAQRRAAPVCTRPDRTSRRPLRHRRPRGRAGSRQRRRPPGCRRRAAAAAAGSRARQSAARSEVHAQLEDPGVLVAVGGKRQGKLDAPIVAVDVKDDLLDPTTRRERKFTSSIPRSSRVV